ncbi:MAG: VOC family protein [Candidatus Pseudobacter hemicellulosilyticus]|uniref:VOC family protein n=1 Tax=Candidatus Pseudobacter hemicellulosilyticus TaxID=3121375 RepID=A0AAJ5WQ62_9BACT|nr:MAG: VOC family protein [Pseudobacter sp.]
MKENLSFLFEIPVKMMERAVRFYESVFNVELSRHTLDYPTGKVEMAWFPNLEDKAGVGGTLIDTPSSIAPPDGNGILVYLNSMSNDIDAELARVEREGGIILTPKTFVSKVIGYIGMFMDTEGNKVALLSRK